MKLLSKKGKYAWLAMAVTASLLGGTLSVPLNIARPL